LGGAIGTLLFFYISGIIFIYGGELNAVLLARRRGKKQSQKEYESFARASRGVGVSS
jgi:uncharacterized BrkB/YihY/UPF0761 family membrane protein